MAAMELSENEQMLFMFDSHVSKKINSLAERTLKEDKILSEKEAQEITRELQRVMKFEPVRVHFMNRRCELNIKDLVKGCVAGRAYPKSRAVVLWEKGHRVSVLLHEIAHLLPGGDRGHFQEEWINNFQNLVTVYNERF